MNPIPSNAAAPAAPLPGRRLSLLDRCIAQTDAIIKSALGPHVAARPYPGENVGETVTDPPQRKHVAALMRVNHAGEIAAQALYHGQALIAKPGPVREAMLAAAREETDHLAWCAQRIGELGGRTSLLDPFWYAGSFAIGAVAGLAGDRYSLGFVAETERQVVEHLESHLNELPKTDARTRAVLEQMSHDEARHGGSATAAGGITPPLPIQKLMALTARMMTTTARWL